ncbi:hypothetical protein DVA81_19470, partial [Acinetobacter baumannii]
KGLIVERREPANTAFKLGDELHGLFSELEDAALYKKKKKKSSFSLPNKNKKKETAEVNRCSESQCGFKQLL